MSLQGEPPVFTPGQLETLGQELEKALSDFEPVLKAAEAEKPASVQMSNDELIALLNELKPLLVGGDFGATGYVAKLAGVKGMEGLIERIDDYDFEDALKILNELI
jgi:hypothetical protein